MSICNEQIYFPDSGVCARHPIPFSSPVPPNVPPLSCIWHTECAGLAWALQACSPNCRTQMPIHSRMSCSSGPGLARGSPHPCGTWPCLRSCPRRVYLSAKEGEIFGIHLLKQAHPGFRASHLQLAGECVELAPPTDRRSKQVNFSTLQALRVKLIQLLFVWYSLPCLKASYALTPGLGQWWDWDRFALAVPQILSNTVLWPFHQTKLCSNPGIAA